jgi:hypothetical protein
MNDVKVAALLVAIRDIGAVRLARTTMEERHLATSLLSSVADSVVVVVRITPLPRWHLLRWLRILAEGLLHYVRYLGIQQRKAELKLPTWLNLSIYDKRSYFFARCLRRQKIGAMRLHLKGKFLLPFMP